MLTINVVGFDPSSRTPRMYFAIVLGGPGTSAGAAKKTILLYANMITANLTGAGPAFTCTAGTATVEQVIAVTDPAQAGGYFGRGSPAALGCAAAFAQFKGATLYVIPVAVAGGAAAATAVITVTASSNVAITINVYIAGRVVQINTGALDSVTTIALAIANAINNAGDLPVTAQSAAGVVTLTAKVAGTPGNSLQIRATMILGANTAKINGAAPVKTLGGVTLTMSGGTIVGNAYQFAGGTGTDSLTLALAAVASSGYDRHVLAATDATNINKLKAQLDLMAAAQTDIWQQGIAASIDTYANAIVLSAAVNGSRQQIVWQYNSDATPIEIAAQMAAARLYGDSVVGGAVIGEQADSAANLNGVMLATIPQQDAVGDRPTPNAINNALSNGLVPLVPTPSNPGYVGASASITSRFLDGNSLPNYSVWKTKIVTVSDQFAYDARSDISSAFAGCKLKPDTSDASPTKAALVITPRDVRARIAFLLKDREENGTLMNVDAHMGELVVMIDPTNPNRCLADIPEIPIADFDGMAANIRALSP